MNLRNLARDYDTYMLNTGEIAGGASKVMMDLFNASNSGVDLIILAAYITPKTDVAVTGAVSAVFNLNRTTSIGTGGTGHSYKGSAPLVLNITPFDTNQPALPPGVTARQAPTGGATPADWILSEYVFPEETNAAAITQQNIDILNASEQTPPIVLHAGQGIVFSQGSVASVNSYVFTIVFGVGSAQKVYPAV